MLEEITPLILTYDEAPNIARTLEAVRWARDIVVVDSFSQDQTLEIISRYRQARVFQRKFDGHDRQWNFGLKETGIQSEWVLALDADFLVSAELAEEIAQLQPQDEVAGYRVGFVFYINGCRLRTTLCPPQTVLYRRELAEYVQDGHTQKLVLTGRVEALSAPILHDDRKPFRRWLQSQRRYATLEAEKILSTPFTSLDFADRVRRLRIIAPLAMLLYCLFVRGAILEGRAGALYSVQRMIAELILTLRLIEHDFGIKQHRKALATESVEPAAD